MPDFNLHARDRELCALVENSAVDVGGFFRGEVFLDDVSAVGVDGGVFAVEGAKDGGWCGTRGIMEESILG